MAFAHPSVPHGAAPPSQPGWALETIREGSSLGSMPLTCAVTVLGREPPAPSPPALAGVRVDHPSASRAHAALYFSHDTLYLVDLGSTHGTFLNKRQLPPGVAAPLAPGQAFSLGASTRRYVIDAPPPALEEGDGEGEGERDETGQEGGNSRSRATAASASSSSSSSSSSSAPPSSSATPAAPADSNNDTATTVSSNNEDSLATLLAALGPGADLSDPDALAAAVAGDAWAQNVVLPPGGAASDALAALLTRLSKTRAKLGAVLMQAADLRSKWLGGGGKGRVGGKKKRGGGGGFRGAAGQEEDGGDDDDGLGSGAATTQLDDGQLKTLARLEASAESLLEAVLEGDEDAWRRLGGKGAGVRQPLSVRAAALGIGLGRGSGRGVSALDGLDGGGGSRGLEDEGEVLDVAPAPAPAAPRARLVLTTKKPSGTTSSGASSAPRPPPPPPSSTTTAAAPAAPSRAEVAAYLDTLSSKPGAALTYDAVCQQQEAVETALAELEAEDGAAAAAAAAATATAAADADALDAYVAASAATVAAAAAAARQQRRALLAAAATELASLEALLRPPVLGGGGGEGAEPPSKRPRLA